MGGVLVPPADPSSSSYLLPPTNRGGAPAELMLVNCGHGSAHRGVGSDRGTALHPPNRHMNGEEPYDIRSFGRGGEW